jgi:hypothetical protein
LSIKSTEKFFLGLGSLTDLSVAFGPSRPGVLAEAFSNEEGDVMMGSCLIVEDEVVSRNPKGSECDTMEE